jgi:hypothetical protein
MTDKSTIGPSALLATVESLPFPERLKYVARVPASQRHALKAHLDQLTNIPSNGSETSTHRSERLALMMGLDRLEEQDPRAAARSPVDGKKGTSKVAVGALGVGVVVAVIAVSTNTHSRGTITYDPQNPYAPPPASLPSGVRQLNDSRLQSEIDAGRAELRSLESRLRSLKSDLDLLETQLSSYKAEINREESNARLGLYVNEYGYRAAVNNYNALVPQYNLQLQTYNSRYAEYDRVLNRTNQLVDQYNAGLRR